MEAAVAEALARVRALAPADDDHAALGDVRDVLVELAALFASQGWAAEMPRLALLPSGDFDVFEPLSIDDDGRYALYVWLTSKQLSTVPHDHKTWAVVAGVTGEERNKLYHLAGAGAASTAEKVRDEVAITEGVGLVMLPDDVHSEMIDGRAEPVLQLHLYGKSIDLLTDRRIFDAAGQCTIMNGDVVPSLDYEFQPDPPPCGGKL